jgi:hypothetical protein
MSLQRNLLSHKRKSFTDAEILDKEEDLAGIMHPLTIKQLITSLLSKVDYCQIWQSYNFKCYVLQTNK